ncbi:hypothetical protein BD626DRAFT_625268 [Schizophyllum amplum]|uniref:Uncharacterized protein n=1 Tax=Schizophyllum amplum TaxID=97359 RepID=A0A550CYZ5_9AGAR|nr:hypothetical protein BD626DRAFT_625268 [Auriculariopsis ampla]
MSRILATGLLLASSLGMVAAQLSSECTQALTDIGSNSDASACLSPNSLTPLFSGNGSVVDPITEWLGNICPSAACSNDTISAIVTNVTTGCGTELTTLGMSASDVTDAIPVIQQMYPTVREALCLQDGDTNCAVQSLNNLQDILGELTITNLYVTFASDDVTIPSNITCSDCQKALYNTLKDKLELIEDAAVQEQCGADFVDGVNPTNIKQAASSETASADSDQNAAQMLSSGLVGAFMAASITFGAAFALLG